MRKPNLLSKLKSKLKDNQMSNLKVSMLWPSRDHNWETIRAEIIKLSELADLRSTRLVGISKNGQSCHMWSVGNDPDMNLLRPKYMLLGKYLNENVTLLAYK